MNEALSKDMLRLLARFDDARRGQVLIAWLNYCAYGILPNFDDLAVDTATRAIILLAERSAELRQGMDRQKEQVLPTPQNQAQAGDEATQPMAKDTIPALLLRLCMLKGKAMQLAGLMLDKDRAKRLAACTQHVIETTAGYLASKEQCQGRICPVCRDKKATKQRKRLLRVHELMKEKAPSAKYLSATFTIENVPLRRLDKAIGDVSQAWGNMIKRPVMQRNCYGFVKIVHVQQGQDGLANLHLHVLFAMRASWRKEINIKDCSDFKTLWAQAVGKKYKAEEVIVKALVGDDDVERMIAYIANSGITSSAKGQMINDDVSAEELAWIAAADKAIGLARRFVSYGGLIKSIVKDMKEGKTSDWLDDYEPLRQFEYDNELKNYVIEIDKCYPI